MELHKAVRSVLPFAARGKKSPEIYRSVLLCPQADGTSWVYATDGVASAMTCVGIELPYALLPVERVAALPKFDWGSARADKNSVTFLARDGGIFEAQARDSTAYPRPPAMCPTMSPLQPWSAFVSLANVAATVSAKSALFQHLRLRPTCVEATDAARVAVADVPGWREDALLPARLVRGWKHGPVEAAFTPDMAWLRRGDEVRMSPITVGPAFPDCASHLPPYHTWPALVLEVKEFRSAVQKAVAASAKKLVRLCLRENGCEVQSYSDLVDGRRFQVVVPGVSVNRPRVDRVVSGKLLLRTLQAATTPCVRLCVQDDEVSPVRIESGAIVEGIWPWRL